MNIKQVIFLIFISFNTYAQEVNMLHYDLKDGLVSNAYFDMHQDQTGRIWFGSNRGMYSFNGDKFKHYTIADGLADTDVLHFFEDSKKRLWLGTYNGHLSYIRNDTIYSSLKKQLPKSPNSYPFFMFNEDQNGNVVFASTLSYKDYYELDSNLESVTLKTARKGVNPRNLKVYFDAPNIFQNPNFNKKDSKGIQTSFGHFLDINDKGQVAKLSSDGIEVYNNDGTLNSELKTEIEIYRNRIIFEKDNLWVIGNGVDLYKLERGEINFITKFLKGIVVNDVMLDLNNHTWFSTSNNGIYKLKSTDNLIKSTQFPNHSLNRIAVFDSKNIFLNMNIMELRKTTNLEKVTTVGNPLSKVNISSLVKQGDKLWFSGEKTGFIYKTGAKKPFFFGNKDIGMLKSLNISNQMWFIERNSLYKNESNELINENIIPISPENQLYQFTLDSFGNYYFNTKLGFFVKREEKTFEVSLNEIAMPSFNFMQEITPGIILIGTNGSGLYILKNGNLNATPTNQLTGNICKKSIIKNDTIFVLTELGINLLSYKNDELRLLKEFTTKNNLFQSEIIDFDICQDSIYAIDRKMLYTFSSQFPTEIGKSFLNCSFLENPSLTRKQSDFPIELTTETLFFENHELLTKQFRLNSNEPWTTFTNNKIPINTLEYGSYEPEIRVFLNNGAIVSSAKINLEVTAPFYTKSWFQMLILAGILLIIFQYINYQKNLRINRELERLKLVQKLNKLELQANRATMNPHFLFNILSSIQYYINANEKSLANKFITKFSKLVRFNLDAVHEGYVSLKQELDFLQTYLELESLRLQKQILLELEIDEDINLETDKIPSMMLQPFFENSVWHGFTSEGVTEPKILLRIHLQSNLKVLIEISDNGMALEKNTHSHKSKALTLIKERLTGYGDTFNTNFRLENTALSPNGYMVSIEVPIANNPS